MSFSRDSHANEVRLIKREMAQMDLKLFLFSFDNIDFLEKNEYDHFCKFMYDITQNLKNEEIKFLFSSSRCKGHLFKGEIGFKTVQKLTRAETVDMFLTKFPQSESSKQKYFEFERVMELHQKTEEFY